MNLLKGIKNYGWDFKIRTLYMDGEFEKLQNLMKMMETYNYPCEMQHQQKNIPDIECRIRVIEERV